MKFTSIKEFAAAHPAVKDMPEDEQKKAMEAFNSAVEKGKDSKTAFGAAMKKCSDVVTGMVFMLSDKSSIIEILRAGTVHDRGFKITEEMLEEYVQNFNAGVYGTKIQVDLRHDREGEAAGWVTKLIKEGNKLLAQVEWTPLGQEKIQTKQYQFTSAELALSYPHFETGKAVKNVLIGVALTNIPAVKGLAPVALSEEVQVFINNQSSMEKLKELFEKLNSQDLISEGEMKKFSDLAEKNKGEETDKLVKTLSEKVVKPAEKKTEDVVKLNEKLEAEKKTNVELAERIDRMELSEKFDKTFAITADKKTGFANNAENKEAVIAFQMSLSPEQRVKFAELMGKVQTVDLSTKGSADAKAKDEADAETKQLSEAETKAAQMAKDSGKPYHECLSEVYRGLEMAKK